MFIYPITQKYFKYALLPSRTSSLVFRRRILRKLEAKSNDLQLGYFCGFNRMFWIETRDNLNQVGVSNKTQSIGVEGLK